MATFLLPIKSEYAQHHVAAPSEFVKVHFTWYEPTMYMPVIKHNHSLKSITLWDVRRNYVYMYKTSKIHNKDLHERK